STIWRGWVWAGPHRALTVGTSAARPRRVGGAVVRPGAVAFGSPPRPLQGPPALLLGLLLELGGALLVPGEVDAGLGVEDVHLGRVEPQLGPVAGADGAHRVEGDDELGTHPLAVQVAVELLKLVTHGPVRLEGDVGVEHLAEPL